MFKKSRTTSVCIPKNYYTELQFLSIKLTNKIGYRITITELVREALGDLFNKHDLKFNNKD